MTSSIRLSPSAYRRREKYFRIADGAVKDTRENFYGIRYRINTSCRMGADSEASIGAWRAEAMVCCRRSPTITDVSAPGFIRR